MPPALRTPNLQPQRLQPLNPVPPTLRTEDMSTSRDDSLPFLIVEFLEADVALSLAFSPLLLVLIMPVAAAAGWNLVIFGSKLVINPIV